jgi:predicted nucleic acid-binding protein
MSAVLYVDTSAVLRAVLERGLTPAVERRLAAAEYLITSRLALVESARAFHRLRLDAMSEAALARASGEADSIWARCTVWELTGAICELAAAVAPRHALRPLDALHLATFLTARRHLGADLELLTADTRLEAALRAV